VDGQVSPAETSVAQLADGRLYAAGPTRSPTATTGSWREFRVFRTALSTAELDAVRQSNTDLGSVTALRLPFDTISTTPHARM
jgi:hypothetical protein